MSRDDLHGARARRVLLADLALALALALLLLWLAAGLGVIATICLPLLLAGLAWIGVERAIVGLRRRRSPSPGRRRRRRGSALR